MHKGSSSQFFRTTTGIQSGLVRFVMTFLTVLGVTERFCSFRLVLDGKTGKEILLLLYQTQKTTPPDH